MKKTSTLQRLALVAVALIAFQGSTADASVIVPVTQVDVTYTSGTVEEGDAGSLALGLSVLPDDVTTTFLLGTGTVGLAGVEYFIGDVSSAQVSFGSGLWTDLSSFSMRVQFGNVTSLSYQFAPSIGDGIIIMNFPLEIVGDDFRYVYSESTSAISSVDPVPEPATLLLLAFGLMGTGLIQRGRKSTRSS